MAERFSRRIRGQRSKTRTQKAVLMAELAKLDSVIAQLPQYSEEWNAFNRLRASLASNCPTTIKRAVKAAAKAVPRANKVLEALNAPRFGNGVKPLSEKQFDAKWQRGLVKAERATGQCEFFDENNRPMVNPFENIRV